MEVAYMPFIVAIVITIAIFVGVVAYRAIEANERIEMIKRGFVPKGYERIDQANSDNQNVSSAANQQPSLPAAPMPWGSQEWNAGLPTSVMNEKAKDH